MTQPAPPGFLQGDVQDMLIKIQKAVRNGERATALSLAGSFHIPLGLTAQDVSATAVIGGGAESTVLLGHLNDQPVAIKKYVIRHAEDLDRFRKELLVLASLQHPNIIHLTGARVLPPDYFLVMPLGGPNLSTKLYEQGWRPNWAEVLTIACRLASALQHVHAHGVVHRDIKPSNLLQGEDGEVKLVDFGITEYTHVLEQLRDKPIFDSKYNIIPKIARKPSGGFHKRQMAGTLEYMAPEVLLKTPQSMASDVYAFAVTVNELITAVVPFSDCTRDNPLCHTVLEMGYGRQELASAVAGQGLRPTVPSFSPPGYQELMSACWHMDPRHRPSFEAIQQHLQSILLSLPAWCPTTGCILKMPPSKLNATHHQHPLLSASDANTHDTQSVHDSPHATSLHDEDTDCPDTPPLGIDRGVHLDRGSDSMFSPGDICSSPDSLPGVLSAAIAHVQQTTHTNSTPPLDSPTDAFTRYPTQAMFGDQQPPTDLYRSSDPYRSSLSGGVNSSQHDSHHHDAALHSQISASIAALQVRQGADAQALSGAALSCKSKISDYSPCAAVCPASVSSVAGTFSSQPQLAAFGSADSSASRSFTAASQSVLPKLSSSSPAFIQAAALSTHPLSKRPAEPLPSLSASSPAFSQSAHLALSPSAPSASASSPAFTQSHLPAHSSLSLTTPSSSSSSPAFTAAAVSSPLLQQAPHMHPALVPQVTAGMFETINSREHMEDRSFAEVNLDGSESTHLFAVFDGHRGGEASHFAAQHFIEVLQEHQQLLGLDWHHPNSASSFQCQQALSNTFIQLDSMFYEKQENVWKDRVARLGPSAGTRPYPGCTALAALLHGSRLLVANAGDCRAVVSRSGCATQLTMDHTAASLSERLRLTTMGAKVEMRHGTWRIGRSGLQVTRSIGDFDEKPNGVISVPEVTQYEFTPTDEFLILASDGLWDVVGIQEAVGLVMDTVKQPYMCAQRLAAEAVSRRSMDNITVIVIFLQPVPSLEEVFSKNRTAHVFTPTFFGSRTSSSQQLNKSTSQVELPTMDEMYDLAR